MPPKKTIDPTATTRPDDDAALKINLRHLRAFAIVAATGSMKEAAEALFRVPSAVTRAVSELESGLGVLLFERMPRGTLLTAYGKAVLERARRVDNELILACQEMTPGDTRGSSGARGVMESMFSGRRLALFASLSDMHNMPAVSRVFGVTQPALSALVRDLEQHAGCDLFIRSAAGMLPTRSGQQLAFRCKRALAELRSIDSDLAILRGVVRGRVVVGALPLSRTLLLPSAIAALVERHPQVRVITVESPYELLAAELRSGELDFILGALRPMDKSKELFQEPVFDDVLSLVVRAGHPLADQPKISFVDLYRASWVLSREGSPSRELLERFFRDLGQTSPQPTVETGDLALLRGLLLKSDMVTAISAQQLYYEIEAGMLQVLNFPLTTTRRQIGITRRSTALAAPCAMALIEEVRRCAQDLR